MIHTLYKGDVVADEKCPTEPDIKAVQLARVKGRDGSYSIVAYDTAANLKAYTDAFADPGAPVVAVADQSSEIEWLKKQLLALQVELAAKKVPKAKTSKKKGQEVTA